MVASFTVYNVAKSPNTNYHTLISVPDAGLSVVCDTPEQLQLAVQSTWETRLPGGLAGAYFAGRDATAGVLGLGYIHKEETRNVWQGNSPTELQITLLLDAESNARRDVYDAAMTLFAIAHPEENANGMMFPPGPNRLATTKNAVHVSVGRYWRMDDGLMTSVTPTFETRLAADGYPISGQVDITIRSSTVWTRSTLIKNGMLAPGTFGQQAYR